MADHDPQTDQTLLALVVRNNEVRMDTQLDPARAFSLLVAMAVQVGEMLGMRLEWVAGNEPTTKNGIILPRAQS